jgi:hypothetical protein
VRDHMPGQRNIHVGSLEEHNYSIVQGWTNRGPSRAPRPGKAGTVTVTRRSDSTLTHPAYGDKALALIIEQGEARPRVLPAEIVIEAERARVEGREDLRALEQQFAGIGVSGTYGSLDRRKPKREGSN